MLKVDSLHADIGGSRILRGVTLEVGPGEVACLMGRNGVGKTTTLKSITGLRDIRSGSISLDGTPLKACRLMPGHGWELVMSRRAAISFLT